MIFLCIRKENLSFCIGLIIALQLENVNAILSDLEKPELSPACSR